MEHSEIIQVLIVDDDSLVSEMTQGIVEEIGYVVVGKAINGQQGIDMTISLKPDVVLMDIEMPDMDGIEASRQIQQVCPTPIVILTAYDTQTLVKQASLAGVGAYLIKPPDTLEMERAITIAIARFKDLMELRELNDLLQTRNQQLGRRNEELDAFAHMVAHDLKNPLHLIITYIQYMEMELKPSEELKMVLDIISQTGHKMNSIIEALLLLAAVRKESIILEMIDTKMVIDEALQRFTHVIEQHKAEIVLPDEWPVAIGYASWLEEVWANYISNAIKYGGRPPRMELGATIQPDKMVRFWVRDNGAGLTPEQQELLFSDFTRLDREAAEGHGLGLSIVKRIVEKLGGQVGVESEVGQGSCFSFTLLCPAE